MDNEMGEFARAFKLFQEEKEKQQIESDARIEQLIDVLGEEKPAYHEPVDWDNLFTDVVTLNNEVKPTRKK